MPSPTIAIVGGGPCGLTLARLLECKGIDYMVYERDESKTSNRAGGSLDIHPETGQRALRECGLYDEFQKYARYEDTLFSLADKHGTKVFQIGEGHDAPEIDRRPLRGLLLQSIPDDRIQWGHVLQKVSQETDGEGQSRPVLYFSNGVVISGCELVVGADGAWSKVRPVTTNATPQYSGKSYLEARIGLDNPLYETMTKRAGVGTFVSIGSGNLTVTQRQGDGSYRIYFGLPVPQDFFSRDGSGTGTVDVSDLDTTRHRLLTDFYADWSEDQKELIRHSTDFRPWPLYTLSTDDMGWISVSGITLAGDAAHLALPNGEGVNQGMTDALELVTSIAKHGLEQINQAVREYESSMNIRAKDHITQGLEMAKVMFSDDPQPFVELLKSFGAEE